MSNKNQIYAKHSPRLLTLFDGKITPTIGKQNYETPTKQKNSKTMLKTVLDDIWKSKLNKIAKKPRKCIRQNGDHLGKRGWEKFHNEIDLTKSTSSFKKIKQKPLTKQERLKSLEERYKKFEDNYFKSNPDLEGGKASCISKFTTTEETEKKIGLTSFKLEKEYKEEFVYQDRETLYQRKRINKWKQRQRRRNDGKQTVFSKRISNNENHYFKNSEGFNQDFGGKKSVDGAFYRKKVKNNANSIELFNKKKQSLLQNLEESLKELKDNTPDKYKIETESGIFDSEEEEGLESDVKCFTAYSARTNMGLYRDYNEDRVSIIVNILLELTSNKTQTSSFFALFDGHAGAKCADFLKDNLHYFITSQKEYVDDKKTAMRKGIFKAEEEFWKLAQLGPVIDISGSCLLLSLFEGNKCFIANVGDSRTIVSENKGKKVLQLTTDHKPEDEEETRRVKNNGGDIFRNKRISKRVIEDPQTGILKTEEIVKYGPFRVSPGGLSVSRTIGDIPSKDPKLGGAQSCVIPTPEIKEYLVKDESDFMVLACDGVYDVLSNDEVVNAVWESIERCAKFMSLEEVSRIAAENVMKASFDKRSMDNITVIVILFRDRTYYINGRKEKVFL